MQKLSAKLKNAPRNVQLLQVPCSANLSLNKEETLSVVDDLKNNKLTDNNPEGVQPEYTQGLNAKFVYVLSKTGIPLMPCKSAKAKHLLKGGKAKVIKRLPFTIQLTFDCDCKVQNITLGIDTGYENIGFSAVSDKNELISGVLKLDKMTSKRLLEKTMYRKARRRRLWYRKSRFLNRKKEIGSLPPSIERRYQTHLKLIERIKKLLPISEIIVETAKFDIQKIINPDINGKQYSQGNLYEYQNIRSYLMAREGGKCQLCGKEFSIGQPSHIHHCKPKSEEGSNRVENLAILHKTCHEKLHEKGLTLSTPKSYKSNAFMNIIHKRFKQHILNVKITYGYETFIKRNELKLEKSHNNDAFVIANGINQKRVNITNIIQRHRRSRKFQLNRKGYKRAIKTRIYKPQPKDLVKINGKFYSVVTIKGRGKEIELKNYPTSKSVSTKKIEMVYKFGSFVWN